MKFFGIVIVFFLAFLNSLTAFADVPTQTIQANGRTVTVECFHCEVEVQSPPSSAASVNYFDWSLGVGVSYLSARGGPSSTSVEGLFDINLKMLGYAWFSLQGGPGVDYDGEEVHATLTELIAVDWRLNDWVEISTGVRHRAAFGRDGGSLNAVGGEIGLGLHFGGLHVGLAAMLGTAWFPTERHEQTPLWEESEVQIKTIKETGSGFAWSTSLDLGWRF